MSQPTTSDKPSPARPDRDLLVAWVLLLIERADAHGYGLRRRLETYGVSADTTALYRTLRRLESDGLVLSRWTKSTAGPARRQYRLTEHGRRGLHELATLIAVDRAQRDAFLHALSQSAPRPAAAR